MKELNDLHAFADGELTAEETRAIRVWIAQDASAQAELNAISNLKDFLKDKSSRHAADDCWKVSVKRLVEIDKSRRVEGFVGKYAWAFCAGLFLLVIGGRLVVSDVRGETVRAADFNLFHSSSQGPSPQAQKVFAQIMAQARANRSGLRVLNESYGLVKDTPVNRCIIADDRGQLNYYVIESVVNLEDSAEVSAGSGLSGGVIPSPTDVAQSRLSYVLWVESGRTHILIGPRSAEELGQAATQLGLKTSLN